MGGWAGGWLEIWRVKLISTQVVVEVEVGVELGNKIDAIYQARIIFNCEAAALYPLSHTLPQSLVVLYIT